MTTDSSKNPVESPVVSESVTDSDPLGDVHRPATSRFGNRAMALAGYAAGVSAALALAGTPTHGSYNPFA